MSINIELLRLTQHRRFPRDAKPGKICENLVDEFRLAAQCIAIFQADQKPATHGACTLKPGQCRAGMAEVQPPMRGRRKAEHGLRQARLLNRAGERGQVKDDLAIARCAWQSFSDSL